MLADLDYLVRPLVLVVLVTVRTNLTKPCEFASHASQVSTLNVGLLQPEDQAGCLSLLGSEVGFAHVCAAAKEKVVKRYGHFEIFFGDIWAGA